MALKGLLRTSTADAGKVPIVDADGNLELQALTGDVTVSNAGVTTIGSSTVAVGNVTLATGSVIIGAAGVGSALDAKTTGRILVGNGTTVTSVAVSGDATLASTGALTIANDAVTAAKIGTTSAGVIFKGAAANTVTELVLGDVAGKIAIGNGANDIVAASLSGDVTMDGTGAVTIANTAVEVGMLGANLQKGIIDLALTHARELAANATQNIAAVGGLLCSDTTPTLQAITATKELGAHYAVNIVDEIAWAVSLPADFDDATAAVFKCRAQKGSNTDTVAFTVEAFFGVNGTDAGGATGNIPQALGTVTKTLTQANQAAYPANLTITLTPGAHANDTIQLLAAWIEYTRKT